MMKLPAIFKSGSFLPRRKPDVASGVHRPFSAAQIEITSRCTTGCLFCPHDALSSEWVDGDLALETYQQHIVPHLHLFDLVYLQGWGEPMLHPRLWDMLDLAREQGCRTGFTTNGTWLRSEQNRRLIDTGVAIISVSFAGAEASAHQPLRTHSDFALLCANFESLASLKRQRGADHPWLELHFLMTRTNLAELPRVVELAASLGADEVVATNLAYAPSAALDHQRVFAEQPLQDDIEIIESAKSTAERLQIPLRVYPIQVEPGTLVCDADPLSTIYINHKGEVSPCVYLGLTVNGEIPRFYLSEAHPFQPLLFGNVCDGLPEVLQSRSRHHFVKAFEARRASGGPLALFTYMTAHEDEDRLPPPPAPCRWCYKMLGI